MDATGIGNPASIAAAASAQVVTMATCWAGCRFATPSSWPLSPWPPLP